MLKEDREFDRTIIHKKYKAVIDELARARTGEDKR